MIVHAGLIARRSAGYWHGVLIEGPAGSGKSDLALRAVAEGFRLVADDRALLFACDGRLYGRAPDAQAGLTEIRGVGVVDQAFLPFARIVLKVRCVTDPGEIERLPAPGAARLMDVSLAERAIWPFEASAPAKLAAMLEHLGGGLQQGYQAGFAPPGGRHGAFGNSPLRHPV